MAIVARHAVTGMLAAAEVESLLAAALRAFVTLQTNGRRFSGRNLLKRKHLGGGGLEGVVHQRGGLVFFAGLIQFLDVQIKVHVTSCGAVTGFTASFVNRGVSELGFTVSRQGVMRRFGGVAFGAGFAADVLAGVRRLGRLR